MNKNDELRNITLCKLHITFSEPLLWGPILILAIQKLGHMTLPEIYYMESVVVIILIALDIPAGALADMIGKKKLIIIGQAFLIMSFIGFMTMDSPCMVWGANILWAIGASLQGGADTALFYDTLKEAGRESEFKKIQGKALGKRFVLIGLTSLCVGPLASIDLRLPLYISLPFLFIPFFSSMFLKEPIHTRSYSMKEQTTILTHGMKFIFRSKEICFILMLSILVGCVSKLWFFTYNPYFEVVGVDLNTYGFIFFLLNMGAWVSSHYAHQIEQSLKEKTCIMLIIIFIGIPILMMGIFPMSGMAYVVIVASLVRGFMGPFISDYLNRYANPRIRTTILSAESTAVALSTVIAFALFGVVLQKFGVILSLIILGSSTLLLGALLYLHYLKRFSSQKELVQHFLKEGDTE